MRNNLQLGRRSATVADPVTDIISEGRGAFFGGVVLSSGTLSKFPLNTLGFRKVSTTCRTSSFSLADLPKSLENVLSLTTATLSSCASATDPPVSPCFVLYLLALLEFPLPFTMEWSRPERMGESFLRCAIGVSGCRGGNLSMSLSGSGRTTLLNVGLLLGMLLLLHAREAQPARS
jgi:hypothetical protein